MRTSFAPALLALVAGCAPHASTGTPEQATTGFILLVHVQNDQWYDMDIYVEGGIGAPQLLGLVPARSSRSFELSKALLEGATEVRLVADAHGSTQRMVSEPLDFATAYSIGWQLRRTGTSRLTVM